MQRARDARDPNLGTHPMDLAKELLGEHARSCPSCARSAAELEWICLDDPEEGGTDVVVGWLTYCDRCHLQVEFVVDEELTQLA